MESAVVALKQSGALDRWVQHVLRLLEEDGGEGVRESMAVSVAGCPALADPAALPYTAQTRDILALTRRVLDHVHASGVDAVAARAVLDALSGEDFQRLLDGSIGAGPPPQEP